MRGHFALSVIHERAKPGTQANFDKALGVATTTRGWPTILRMRDALVD